MDFMRLNLHLRLREKSHEENLNSHPCNVKDYSLRELRAATDNFDSKNIIGRGGFGTVYRGCLADGSQVAIKRLKENSSSVGLVQFQREIEMISMALHRNLLRLQGFCITSQDRLLVYPYMVNGSVASRLKRHTQSLPPLDWLMRKCVAYGAATALDYLHDHCKPKIIHRDVKADNILLDENFEAVVGDFGLAKLIHINESHVTTEVCGTFGHIAPEYFTTLRCSEKTDVYGYGILLLELITGRRVFYIVPRSEEGVTPFDWMKKLMKEKTLQLVIDSDLHDDYASSEVEGLIYVALQCIQHSPKERPFMSTVVRMLEDHNLVVKRPLTRCDHDTTVFIDRMNQFHNLENLLQRKLEVVGRGSLGTVYKATLDQYTIAIKMLDGSVFNPNNFEQYMNLMANVNHPDILGLRAYHKRGNDRFLVYDYLFNGSFYSLLHEKKDPSRIPLNWTTRYRMILGAARCLACIHEDHNTFHGNVKSSNMLIDKYGFVCISDFGQALLENLDHRVRRLGGYNAPEHRLSREADVYSFGVMVLEVLTGKDPSQEESTMNLPEWLRLHWPKSKPKAFDTELKGCWLNNVCINDRCHGVGDIASKSESKNVFQGLINMCELGYRCAAQLPDDRPTMKEVVKMIEDLPGKPDLILNKIIDMKYYT